jgi:hypothetical protein
MQAGYINDKVRGKKEINNNKLSNWIIKINK